MNILRTSSQAWKLGFWLGTALFLTSCAHLTKQPAGPSAVTTPQTWKEREVALNRIQNWQINGKIGVQTAQDSGSATVTWQQSQSQYTIALYGPLGTHGMKLWGQPGSVTLETSEGKRISDNSPEQLLAKQWGFNLPVSNLRYWVRGLPVPNVPYDSQFDTRNRLSQLTQQGWNVQYLSYTNAGPADLPDRISIISPSLKTKIIIYTWKVS